MLGRTLGGATVASIQGIVVLLMAMAVGFRPVSPWLIPLALGFIFLVALLFTALGTAIASAMEDFQGFQFIVNFLIMPLFFLSGALFPLDTAPKALAIVARFDPLTYGVDALRGALIGSSHIGMHIDFAVLAVVALIILGIGSFLFSKIEI
jgi:ABC-2 type transport system permease protein